MKQPHRSFEKKFRTSLSAGNLKPKVPVSTSLQYLVQNQSFRIQRLLEKKKDQQNKVQRISTTNMNYRQQLRKKIIEQQDKHQKNRLELLNKKVKRQTFKIKQVSQKKYLYQEKQRSKFRKLVELCEQNKQETKKFWTHKTLQDKVALQSQSAVQPLYQDAIHRKKFMELRNQSYAQSIKQQVLKKHQNIKEKVLQPYKEYKQYLHVHNYDHIAQSQQKKSLMLNEKQQKFVNDICFHNDRSQDVLKQNQKIYKKKMKARKVDQVQLIIKNRQNFKQRQKQRYMQKTKPRKFFSAGMTQSINLNEEDSPIKTKLNPMINTTSNIKNWSTMSMRQSMIKSQQHAQKGKTKRDYMRQKRNINDEKKLDLEKDITDAIELRKSIKYQSNNYVRNARMLQVK